MLSVRSLFAEGVMTLLLSVLFLTVCAAEICSAAEVDEDTRHLLKIASYLHGFLAQYDEMLNNILVVLCI